MSTASISLRDALLAALSTLNGVREFHLHVLLSAPKKTTSLYPYASQRPRAYVSDILVLCSEQEKPDAPRVLVTAIAANVYHIPATSSAVFYVSKVDSTGQGQGRSPTAALLRALLSFYADPATRPLEAEHLWIQLFARAQGQYLFPNSAEFSGKQPLTDAKLCSWWKRVLTQVGRDVHAKASNSIQAPKAFYILPGYSQPEAEDLLRIASSSAPPLTNPIPWTYGHPYSKPGIRSPCPQEENEANLGTYIPWFDDDPKSRFIDEIALIVTTTEGIVASPSKKRPKRDLLSDASSASSKHGDTDKSTRSSKEEKPMGELRKVSADEFWERMSFRQECVSGAVTGFFTVVFSTASTPRTTVSPLAPRAGQVSPQLLKRLMTLLLTGVEFSTRDKSVRSTETVESAIKGLCEGISAAPSQPVVDVVREKEASLAPLSTPPRNRTALPDISPNPFPEPVASLDTYHSYIYGSIGVDRPISERVQASAPTPAVTVLTARRKKKRGET